MAKIVVFANQKGGVGKTTLCNHLANYLVTKNYKVLVGDADPQQTFFHHRNDDFQAGEFEELEQDGKRFYDIPYLVESINIDNKDEVIRLAEAARTSPYDVVLFDAPGTIQKPNVSELLVRADVIAIPYMYEYGSMDSTGKFTQIVANLRGLVVKEQMKDMVASAGGDKEKIRQMTEDIQASLMRMVFIPTNFDKRRTGKDMTLYRLRSDLVWCPYGLVTPTIFQQSCIQNVDTVAMRKQQMDVLEGVFKIMSDAIFGDNKKYAARIQKVTAQLTRDHDRLAKLMGEEPIQAPTQQ